MNESVKKPNIIKRFSVVIILAAQILTLSGQNLLRNGGMNGVAGDSNFPDEWFACQDWSTPDLFMKYTPKLSGSGSVIPPLWSPPFVFLRTRSKYRSGLEYTYEYISQKLTKPLEKDSLYDFSTYYCFNPYNDLSDDQTFTMAPVRLELWAGNDSCVNQKLIMQTEALKNPNWQKKTCTFKPDTSYTFIRVVASWDSMNMNPDHEAYEGMILLDELSITKSENDLTSKVTNLIFKGDGKTTLSASEGTSYSWSPLHYLDKYNVQSPTMTRYDSVFSVFIGSLTNCSSVEKFYITLICDTLHPESEKQTFIQDYDPYHQPLVPDEGVQYTWDPEDKVTDYNSPNPEFTEFDSIITVTIKDKYNCEFKQKFILRIDCEKIAPEKNIEVLNTTLDRQSSVILVPKSENIIKYWNPQNGLSCTECLTPTARPDYSTNYLLEVKDKYGCIHTESFNVKVKLFIPNIITPNDDGVNDYFQVSGIPDNTTLKIFNKAGYLLYSATPYKNNTWNGVKDDGTPLSTDNYWYVLENTEAGLLEKGFIFVKRSK